MPPRVPKEIATTVDFKKYRCDMTELTVVEHDWTESPMYVYSVAGLNQTVDKLARFLANARAL